MKTGLWIQFYETGQVKMELNYEDGLLNGISKAYNEEGVMIEEVEFKDNQMVRRIK
jgi:antitoxin component YwqK of YwqJK toxin-antitoxin module